MIYLFFREDKDITTKRKHQLKSLYCEWFPNEKSKLILNLKKPIPIQLTDVNFIKPIISSYNQYLTHFVKDLLNLVEPKLSAVVSEKICKLAKLISEPCNNMFSKQLSSRIYTEADLKSPETSSSIIIDDVEENMSDNLNNCQQVTGIWRLASKSWNWGTCPIGQMPQEDFNATNLEDNTENMQIAV